MAYSVLDGIHHSRYFIKNIPVDAIQIVAADDINARIHKAYPWRWSTSALTPISLVDSTQDYSSAPTDYFRLLRARIVRTDSTPDDVYEPLDVVNKLEPKLWPTSPRLIKAISYEGHLNKFRLERAAQVTSPSTFEIQGEYQKVVTKITNTSDSLPFPDQYFSVFVQGLKWKFYEFADDVRAGTANYNKDGQFVCTGQAATFYGELFDMASQEGYAAGDPIAPAEPLMYE
jgi:hypothetical protein